MQGAKGRITNFFQSSRTNKLIAVGVALTVVLVGYVLVRIHASGFFVASEAEQSSLSSNAQIVSDASASGGSAIKFTGPAPTPTPTPPPPTPPPSGGGTCPLPQYPKPSCTGVPAGTAFTNTVNGDYTVTTAGQTIDKWHITGDLIIHASNVVVTNTQVDRTVDNEGSPNQYFPYTITDSTVGPATGCIVAPGVGSGSYTATRIYVRGHDDGFRMSGSNVTVQDSYQYACYAPPSVAPPDGSHSDGIQSYCPGTSCTNLHFLHNTLDLSGVPATFPINLNDPNLGGVTANDNLLLGGGNYLIDAQWHSGANWVLHNNRLVKDTWDPAHPYPNVLFSATSDGTCAHEDWSGTTIVTIDSNYNITSTVQSLSCLD